MKIGIIETGEVDPELQVRFGTYADMFSNLLGAVDPSLHFVSVSVVTGASLGEITDADGWLVTGSRHGVYDNLPWMAPLRDFLRDAVAAKIPVVGICFGHQIMAQALGGKAEKSERGWGLGVQEYRVTNRMDWMAAIPDRFCIRAVHQDQIVDLPDNATILAASDHCPAAVVAYGDPAIPDALSIQAHPEYSADFLDELLAIRGGKTIPLEQTDAARAGLHAEVHRHDWVEIIVAFFHRAHGA